MKKLEVRLPLRIDRMLLDKFGYVAAFNGRKKNEELNHMIHERIALFESQHGKISSEMLVSLRKALPKE